MRILPLAIIATSALAFAGSGGISPADGYYGFFRTYPAPPTNVGTGGFSTGASGQKELLTNPNGGPTEKWTKGADGQYRKVAGGALSICVHATSSGTPPYEYTYKLNDDTASSGDLTTTP